MISQEQIQESKAIQRYTGHTFHVATRFLPERVRYPTYVLYAFFRTADEIVDDEDPAPPSEQRRRLERMRAAALGEREPEDPVLAAFADLRETHDVPRKEVTAFIDSMLMDVETNCYDSHEELSAYLRGSSVAVGNMMLAVMDPDAVDQARPHAAALAEAFQLTNFIRDVREDVTKYDRIYLPRSALEAHGATTEAIESLRFTDDVKATIRTELRRTEHRYVDGVQGIRFLPGDCQFAVLLAAVMYADQHRLIRDQGYDTLSKRPTLSTWRRVSLAARTWFHWQISGDPLAVFDRLVDVPVDTARDVSGGDEGTKHPRK